MAARRSPLFVNGRRWTLSVLLGSFCVWVAGCAVSSATILSHATLPVTRSKTREGVQSSSPALTASTASAAVVISLGKTATRSINRAGSCLGFAITPTFVLVSTECLQHEFHAISLASARTLVVTVPGVDEDASFPVALGFWSPEILNGASFVVLQTTKPLTGVTPAMLQTTKDEQSVTEAKAADAALSLATFDSSSASYSFSSSRVVPIDSCAAQLQPHGKKNKLTTTEWLCVDVDQAPGLATECKTASTTRRLDNETTTTAVDEKPFISDGFLVGFDKKFQREVLWGIVWSSEAKCDPESAGAPLTMAVNTVETIRDLLRKSPGVQWVTLPQASPTQTPAPTITATPTVDPPSQSGSSSRHDDVGDCHRLIGDGSHSASGSSGDVEIPTEPSEPFEPPGSDIYIPAWLDEQPLNAVLLTPTNDTTQPNATLGFFVTSRHLIVSRLWFDGDITTLKYATIASSRKQLQITKIVSEAEFYANQSTSLAAALRSHTDLFVFEMDEPVEAIYELLLLPPKLDVVHEWPEIYVFDTVLDRTRVDLPASQSPSTSGSLIEGDSEPDVDAADSRPRVMILDGDTRFVNTTHCDDSELNAPVSASDPDLLCAAIELTRDIDTAPPAWKMGLLLEDNALVGFTVQSAKDPTKISVTRLSNQIHKTFLDVATGGEILWDARDQFGKDAEGVASFAEYMVTLPTFDEDGSCTGQCTGLLIAPSFILTMASCLNTTRGGFTTAEFTKRNENPRQYAVRADFQVPSPLYETPDDFLFDVAVIGLSEPVVDITPVILNPGYSEWIKNATIQRPEISILSGSPDILGSSNQILLDCGNSSNHNSSRPHKPGKDFLPPRGVCISAEKQRMRRGRFLPGQPLISRTHFGVISASGFSVPLREVSNEEDDAANDPSGPQNPKLGPVPDDGDDPVDSNNSGSGSNQGDEPPTNEQITPSGDVFMSFADNANFINGYVSGVNWGQRTNVQAPPHKLIPETIPSYVVGLRITKDGPNFCSGTLIASSYVLTAAHCVGDALVKYVEVAGESHTEVLAVLADSIVVHQSFGKKFQFSYDAAVLELETSASSHGVVLDKTADYASKTPASMYGFGVLSSADLDKPSSVHTLELPLYSRKQCAATLPDIDDSMLCAGGESGQDACQGDSGGPLVLRSRAQDYLVGIVSAGYGCGLVGVPGVYARASSLIEFVQSYVVGYRLGVSSSSSPTVSPSAAQTTRSSSNESRGAVDSGDIESYSRGPDNGTVTNSSSPHTQKPGFETPIKSVDLSSGLKDRVQVELLAFLMGDSYAFLESPKSPLQKLMDLQNSLTLFSRGDLSGIKTVLQRHNADAKHGRQDRFHRGVSVTALWDPTTRRISEGVCV